MTDHTTIGAVIRERDDLRERLDAAEARVREEIHLREAADRDRDDARVQRIAAEGAAEDLLSAIGDWARPTGSNGMTSPSETHPLMVAAKRVRHALSRNGLPAADTPASAFDKADFFWRTMDPDDNGPSPDEALKMGGVGNYTVCEVASSYAGPTRYGFIAPVLDPETDDEEFLHFATKAEAMTAAGERLAAVEKMRASRGTEP